MAKTSYIWKDRKHILWFPFTFTKYCVKNDRLYIDKGFFNSVSEELLLYRVIDITLTRSLGQKLCGTGTIQLAAKGDRDMVIHLENIKRPKVVKEMLSSLIESVRYEKNVIGSELFGANFKDPASNCDCTTGEGGCDHNIHIHHG